MRLVIANWHRDVIGGAERYLQGAIPELLRRGHDVAVLHRSEVAPNQPTIDPPAARLGAWCVDRLGPSASLSGVADWKPDLIFSHGSFLPDVEEHLASLYPSVNFAHGYDGTCETGTKCHAFPTPRPCTRRFGPICLLLHYPRRCGGLNPLTMLRSYHAEARRLASLGRYQAVLVASRHMALEFSRHGVCRERLHVVPLPVTGVAPDREAPVGRDYSGMILMVGRLTRLKGADHLIRAIPAAARVLGRPLTVSIAGDGHGPELIALEQLARRTGVDVVFHAWLDVERRTACMRRADLLAVPSVWPEPFGLVGIEAGCVGLPAVAYDVGGISDWLVPGRSGELAPGDPPTVDGLVDAIVRALRDPARHASLRRGAWEVASQFTMTAHMNQLEPLLLSVAKRRV